MVRALTILAVAVGMLATVPATQAGNKPAKKGHHQAQLFAKADTNHDGTLSKAEFEAFLAAAKAKAKTKVK